EEERRDGGEPGEEHDDHEPDREVRPEGAILVRIHHDSPAMNFFTSASCGASAALPSKTTRPARIMTIRSAHLSVAAMSCDVSTAVTPTAFLRRLTSAAT